jgi:ribonuclease Z
VNTGFDELHVGGLTLAGVTRGGIATCLMCPELRVMFDVGGTLPGQLRHETILVTHGHQDHLGGLPYLVSQRHLARLGPPTVHMPMEIVAPMRRIFDAWSEIEDFELDVRLVGHRPEDIVDLGQGLTARCLRAVHRVPALSWIIERTTHKLRPELQGLPGEELRRRRLADEAITVPHVVSVLGVTGDTQIELLRDDARLGRCAVLVHEVTSWDDRRDVDETRKWGHTHLDEMVRYAEAFEGEALVLVHRSPRHTKAEAEAIVRARFPASVRDRVHVFGN